MPRELGKAKRADLTGHFPGEQAEYGSALARFLEGAGQLKPLEDGTYLDKPSGNGNGHATEVPGMTRRSSDTEVAYPGGNGQGDAFDTHFDLAGESMFGDAEMTPELAFDTEATLAPAGGQALDLEPVTFEPSADTLSPTMAPEPEPLDSVPDLTSPEHDQLLAEDEEPRAASPDLAPASSGDTGMLVAEAFGTGPHERLSDADLTADDEWTGLSMEREEDDRPTDKLAPRGANGPGAEDDPTDLLKREETAEEKITSKVEPRRDVDPRTRDPNAVVRDTVNFYNQTQSLYEQKQRSGGFPTISPNVVNSGQPLGLRRDLPPRPETPDLLSDEHDTLSPGSMFDMDTEPALSPAEGPALSPAFGPDEEPTLAPDIEPALSPAEGPALSPAEGQALDAEDEPELAAVSELSAEADLDDADKRETDKFRREDREPPDLPLPEGTDKVDKSHPRARKAAPGAAPSGLEPLADEKVAGGKDTQRFYVAEILARKEPGSDTTAELQPAEQGPPPGADSAETSPDFGTESYRATQRETLRPEPEDLPSPSQVHTDFVEHIHVTHADRIIPEIGAEDDDGDDTVDEEAIEPADADRRVTARREAPSQPAARPPARRVPPPAAAPASSGRSPARREATGASTRREPASISQRSAPAVAAQQSRRVTDGLSQRLQREREETLRLIEQAEAVAVKLREASEASRTDLQTISERRTVIRQRPPLPDPDDLHELPDSVEAASSAETVIEEKPTLPPAPQPASAPVPRRVGERVPTRAVGEIVEELQRTAERPAVSLSELLEQVSRRHEPTNGNGHEPDDLDLLVAASSRLRETIESAWEDDRSSGRMPAVEAVDEPAIQEPPRTTEYARSRPEAASSRAAVESTLAADLDRLWQVLDSRRASPVTSRATVVIPAPEQARITPRETDPMDGWTQEMLWPTLAGIAGVTFILGALFVWVLFKLLG